VSDERPPRIDLNADVGESFGAWCAGEDEALIPLVTSVNVAAGFHAGDPLVIERTVALAARAGAAVGAHPGYPDLGGFGRRAMALSPAEIEAAVLYQVGAVAAFARAAGTELHHVKAHGALYNRAARDRAAADAIARAVRRFSTELVLVGLAGSALVAAGRDAGLAVAEEAFADRAYESDGRLRQRDLEGAVLDDPATAAAQALAIVAGGVRAMDGSTLVVRADTICVHGDHPGAAGRARAVRQALERAGVEIRAPG
jgi:5-oxoprolinase (ATP-hydrolysing) subunit A